MSKTEEASVSVIAARIALGSTIQADEAAGWDNLHARFLTKRINHSESYSDGEACTNQAESFFSRLRRAEMGVHYCISGTYAGARITAGSATAFSSVLATNAAPIHPVSHQWKGY